MIDTRDDARWTVYVHIVPKEISGYDWDKYYVGITSLEPRIRWGTNGCGYYRQKVFYSAIKKYDWDNIEHYIVAEKLTEYEAKEFEKVLIKLLKSNQREYGYNRTSGGDGHSGDIDTYKEDMIGKKFGKLTVIEELPRVYFPSGVSSRNFRLKCDCGNTTELTYSLFKYGNTTSCGCVWEEYIKNSRKTYEPIICEDENCAKIYINNINEYFLCDAENVDVLNKYHWVGVAKKNGYALHTEFYIDKQRILKNVYSFIFDKKINAKNIKHINGNTLDFRKDNLVLKEVS